MPSLRVKYELETSQFGVDHLDKGKSLDAAEVDNGLKDFGINLNERQLKYLILHLEH